MPFELKIVFAPLILMCLDIVFGYVGAMRTGTLNSTIMREGLWNKVTELMIIAAGFAAQYCIEVFGKEQLGLSVSVPVSTGICAYLCVYELTSIVENIGKFSQKLGEFFIKILGIDPAKVGLVAIDSVDSSEPDSNDSASGDSDSDSA